MVGRGSAVLRVERGLVVGRRRKLETRLGRAVEPEEVASGGWRVTSLKKKQIPQASRPGRDKFRPELRHPTTVCATRLYHEGIAGQVKEWGTRIPS